MTGTGKKSGGENTEYLGLERKNLTFQRKILWLVSEK